MYIQLIAINRGKKVARHHNCSIPVKHICTWSQQRTKERDNQALISEKEQSNTKTFDDEKCRNSGSSSASSSIQSLSLIACHTVSALSRCVSGMRWCMCGNCHHQTCAAALHKQTHRQSQVILLVGALMTTMLLTAADAHKEFCIQAERQTESFWNYRHEKMNKVKRTKSKSNSFSLLQSVLWHLCCMACSPWAIQGLAWNLFCEAPAVLFGCDLKEYILVH